MATNDHQRPPTPTDTNRFLNRWRKPFGVNNPPTPQIFLDKKLADFSDINANDLQTTNIKHVWYNQWDPTIFLYLLFIIATFLSNLKSWLVIWSKNWLYYVLDL